MLKTHEHIKIPRILSITEQRTTQIRFSSGVALQRLLDAVGRVSEPPIPHVSRLLCRLWMIRPDLGENSPDSCKSVKWSGIPISEKVATFPVMYSCLFAKLNEIAAVTCHI